MAVFRKQITAATAQAAWTNVEADLQAGVLAVCAVRWPDAFREADKLAQLHTAASGSRSLDTLHVAAALIIRTVDFVTFDIREAALAKSTGLKVKPRRQPAGEAIAVCPGESIDILSLSFKLRNDSLTISPLVRLD